MSFDSPVLRPNIGALSVLGGGVVHFEEDLQQLGSRHLGWIVLQLDGLGVPRVARTNLPEELPKQK